MRSRMRSVNGQIPGVFLALAGAISTFAATHDDPAKDARTPRAATVPATASPTVSPTVAQIAYAKKSSVESLSVIAKIPVPAGFADWMTVAFDSIWAPVGGKLVRIDPKTSKVVAELPIGAGSYRGVTSNSKYVWVLNCGSNTLSQIDPATNKVVRTLPMDASQGSEGSIAANDEGVWIVTHYQPGNTSVLTRLDPNDGHEVASTKIPEDSNGVVVAGGSVWVSNTASGTVSKIDTKTNSVTATVATHSQPRFMTVGAGSIWALNQGDGSISRIDLKTNEVTNIAAQTPGGGGDIAFGEGSVWVSVFGAPVVRIDPAKNLPAERFEGGWNADSIRAGLGYVWVADHSGSIMQIKPPK